MKKLNSAASAVFVSILLAFSACVVSVAQQKEPENMDKSAVARASTAAVFMVQGNKFPAGRASLDTKQTDVMPPVITTIPVDTTAVANHKSVLITMATETEDAVISYYIVRGDTIEPATVYSGPFTVSANSDVRTKVLLRAYTQKNGIESFPATEKEIIFLKADSSSGGGTTTESRIKTQTGKEGIETKVSLYPNVEGGTASAEISRTAGEKTTEQMQEKNSTLLYIAVDKTNGTANRVEILMPMNMVKKVNEETSADMLVETEKGSVRINNYSLGRLGEEIGSTVRMLLWQKTDGTWKFSISVSGKELDDIGSVQLEIPYEPENKDGDIAVSFLKEGKAAEILPYVYDKVNRKLAFDTKGTVQFAVLENNKAEERKKSEEITAEILEEKGMPLNDAQEEMIPIDITSHWAKDSILFVMEKGLFQGVSDREFAPDMPISRAMFVTVLYRMAGSPEMAGKTTFMDVPENSYYMDAVTWAEKNKIASGISPIRFAPEEKLTREQLAAILYQYEKVQGGTLANGQAGLPVFSDEALIQGWAAEGVSVMAAHDILKGRPDGRFDPQGQASRAETASILQRLSVRKEK